MQREALRIFGPDVVARLRIPPHAEAVGGLDQDVALVADTRDDLAKNAEVGGRQPVRTAGVDMHDRRPGLGALMRRFGDLRRADRHLCAVPVTLCAAIHRGKDDELLGQWTIPHPYKVAPVAGGSCCRRSTLRQAVELAHAARHTVVVSNLSGHRGKCTVMLCDREAWKSLFPRRPSSGKIGDRALLRRGG